MMPTEVPSRGCARMRDGVLASSRISPRIYTGVSGVVRQRLVLGVVLLLLLFLGANAREGHNCPRSSIVLPCSALFTSNEKKESPQDIESLLRDVDRLISRCDTSKALDLLKNVKPLPTSRSFLDRSDLARSIDRLRKNAATLKERGEKNAALNSYRKILSVCHESKSIFHETIALMANQKKYQDFVSHISDRRFSQSVSDDNILALIIKVYLRIGYLRKALNLIKIRKTYNPEDSKIARTYADTSFVNDLISQMRDCYNSESAGRASNAAQCLKTIDKLDHNKFLAVAKSLDLYSSLASYHSFLCIIYALNANHESAELHCKEALSLIKEDAYATQDCNPYMVDIYISAAESYKALKKYKDAAYLLRSARHTLPSNRRITSLSEECESLLANAPEEDFYSILNVPKNATTKQILAAYKPLAKKYHPDTKPEGPEREKAMEEMAKINGAKETLIDPEKRAEYDNRNAHGNYFANTDFFGRQYFQPVNQRRKIIIHSGGNPHSQGDRYFIRFSSQGESINNPFNTIFDNFFFHDGF